MANKDRNFIRISRDGVIVYPPVVKRFNLAAQCSVFILWNVLGYSWVFFTPVGYSKKRKLFKVNPDDTLYCVNTYTDAARRGDYEITDIDLVRLPFDKAADNEFFTIYRLTKIEDAKQ